MTDTLVTLHSYKPDDIDLERQKTAHLRVNVGCGMHPLAYWTNIDSDPSIAAELHVDVPDMPFDDNSLEEIYAGHVLEHMKQDKAKRFLQECFRCLKPGSRLGVVVPDTRAVMTHYLAGDGATMEFGGRDWKMGDLDDVCSIFLYSTVQPSHHKWSYDQHTLRRAMAVAGFKILTPIDRFKDPRIPVGAWYQCGIDGYKP